MTKRLLLLLAVALVTTLEATLPATVQAAPAATTKTDPNRLSRMRRHLHRQAKMRLRQNRHR